MPQDFLIKPIQQHGLRIYSGEPTDFVLIRLYHKEEIIPGLKTKQHSRAVRNISVKAPRRTVACSSAPIVPISNPEIYDCKKGRLVTVDWVLSLIVSIQFSPVKVGLYRPNPAQGWINLSEGFRKSESWRSSRDTKLIYDQNVYGRTAFCTNGKLFLPQQLLFTRIFISLKNTCSRPLIF